MHWRARRKKNKISFIIEGVNYYENDEENYSNNNGIDVDNKWSCSFFAE